MKSALASQKDTILHQLQNFSILVENRRISATQTAGLKEKFIAASGSEVTQDDIVPVREFLCEAFCLVDIVEELQ